jgi:hypothetical protein
LILKNITKSELLTILDFVLTDTSKSKHYFEDSY